MTDASPRRTRFLPPSGAACDEINGGECKDEMVGALRADVTLDSCFGATTTSESLAAEAPPPDNADDGLSDIAIALIVVASVGAPKREKETILGRVTPPPPPPPPPSNAVSIFLPAQCRPYIARRSGLTGS